MNYDVGGRQPDEIPVGNVRWIMMSEGASHLRERELMCKFGRYYGK